MKTMALNSSRTNAAASVNDVIVFLATFIRKSHENNAIKQQDSSSMVCVNVVIFQITQDKSCL